MNASALPPPLFSPTHAWVEPLGWTLVHFLWQGVLIAKVFAAARALGGRSLSSHVRYSMACVALAVVVLAPVVTFILIASGSAMIPANPAAWAARPFVSSQAALAEWRIVVPSFSRQVFPWLVNAWMCGALVFSVRLIGGWAAASRMRSARSARPAAPEWQLRLVRLMERMRVSRPVQLLVSSLAQTPVVIGHLSPAILVPLSALSGLPVEQVEALLMHELAHIRRADYLVNLLQSVAEALLFYHPSVWWLSNEIRVERELCCDDIAVAMSGDALIYARALAAVESARPVRVQAAMAASGGSLARRISRLLDPTRTAGQTHGGSGAAVALSVLLVLGVGAAAMNRSTVHAKLLPAASAVVPRNEPAPRESLTLRLSEKLNSKKSAPQRVIEEPRGSEAESEARVPVRYTSEGGSNEEEPRYRVATSIWPGLPGEPVLDGIEFRGITEEFARDLRDRLPVREGRRIAGWMRERLGDMIREYGRQLEFGFAADSQGGVVLRIHPPGFANTEPLQLEPRPQSEHTGAFIDERLNPRRK